VVVVQSAALLWIAAGPWNLLASAFQSSSVHPHRYTTTSTAAATRKTSPTAVYSSSLHGYERDTTHDTSTVDEDAVSKLLSERVEFQRQQDYEKADAIRNRLVSEYGVGVYDKDRTWRTGYTSNSLNNNNSSRGSGGGGGRVGVGRDRLGGISGHDYTMAVGAGPIQSRLSLSEIDVLLAARLQAKIARNFDEADRIRRQLDDANVKINNPRKEWRADGQLYFGNYVRVNVDSGGGTISDADLAIVEQRLRDRSQAKINRNFALADKIKQELENQYSVLIRDDSREWLVQPNKYRFVGDKATAFFSDDATTAWTNIEQRLQERHEYKKNRNWKVADEIRDQLNDKYSVMIDDKTFTWFILPPGVGVKRVMNSSSSSRPPPVVVPAAAHGDERDISRDQSSVDEAAVATSRFDRGGGIGGSSSNSSTGRADGQQLSFGITNYVRVVDNSGVGTLSDADVATVEQRLRDRCQAKIDRQFYLADEIKDQLKNQYSVLILDNTKEWLVQPNRYRFVGDTSSIPSTTAFFLDDDETTLAYIERRVQERIEYKKIRNWQAADEIRDQLKDKYSVTIDDKTFSWSILPGVGLSRTMSSYSNSSRPPVGPAAAHGYQRDTSRDQSTVDEDAVSILLSERVEAKRRQDYEKADAIRNRLESEYGVGVIDKDRTWSTGYDRSSANRGVSKRFDRARSIRNFGPTGHDYVMSEDAGPIKSRLSPSDIDLFLAARLHAKLLHQHDEADRLWRLLDEAGVKIHDARKEWRADGQSIGIIKFVCVGGVGTLSDDEVATVELLLRKRSQANINRDFELSDQIKDQLKSQYSVLIRDKTKEWLVVQPTSFSFVGDKSALDGETFAYIEERVKERHEHKKNLFKPMADEIHDQLVEKYSVKIDDEAFEWSIMVPIEPKN
jgi:cysteinyl-tRNA synthetase